MKLLQNLDIDLEKDPHYFEAVYYATSSYSLASQIKWIIHFMLYVKALVVFGTNKKAKECIEKAKHGQHIGCFGLTEIYHGSFNRGMSTEAFYNHKTRSFRITTNHREGQKFWIGGAAEIACMSVIWAQLIVDGQSYGPHPFIVPLRDENTHQSLPGVTVGDVGPKNGANMIDNGWIRLNDVIVPY